MAAQPCKALEDAFAGGSAAGLDLPDVVLCNDVEVESVRDVLWSHGCVRRDMSARVCSTSFGVILTSVDILLVGKDQQQGILHFAVLNDTGQLSASLVHAIAIDRVNDEDQALGAREVVSPQRTDLVLTADVPDVEFGVLVCDGLDVETDRGDCRHVLVQLEFVEDGCLGTSGQHIVALGRKRMADTHWSCQQRRDQASTGAFLCCRRSWPSSLILSRPWWWIYACDCCARKSIGSEFGYVVAARVGCR